MNWWGWSVIWPYTSGQDKKCKATQKERCWIKRYRRTKNIIDEIENKASAIARKTKRHARKESWPKCVSRGLQQEPNLTLYNLNLSFDIKIKFIDIYVDQRLRWYDHMKYRKQKTMKRVIMLKLSHLYWEADKKIAN